MIARPRRAALQLCFLAALCTLAAGLASCGSSGDAGAADGAESISGARLIARSVDRKDPFVNGRLVLIDAGGRRRLAADDLECERVAYSGERGLCLMAEANGEPARAILFDSGLGESGALPLEGLPMQATVSTDGRYGAMTVASNANVEPDDEEGGVVTATTIVDMRGGKPVADLEEFSLLRHGRPWGAKEPRFSGVTFAPDDTRFYATVQAEGTLYLAAGNLKAHTLRLLRAGVDAPSLSPNGRYLAYKAHRHEGEPWRLEVLDLKTMRSRPLAERRQITEQVGWDGNGALVYSDGFDVYTVPVAGHGSPRMVLPDATSPAAPAS